ncbi:histone-lysine N-methyltransferase 2C isoform X2 [Denticeps clupeoides]|uniref:histone-lysine N-methyltransferase 2C isoform X2 n=1 Tax=Denticeps clupeoides TaxID=299321 RepID=UPI0010A41E2B|nr:histone-lysine N-methyltransferase 2C-like isoform X2 [Denticeps clupeoides]
MPPFQAEQRPTTPPTKESATNQSKETGAEPLQDAPAETPTAADVTEEAAAPDVVPKEENQEVQEEEQELGAEEPFDHQVAKLEGGGPTSPKLTAEDSPVPGELLEATPPTASPSPHGHVEEVLAPEAPPTAPPCSDINTVAHATTTFISVTPKIGMGKPAITKRKFSPGRPRVKQGAWSRVTSPSRFRDGPEGWDPPKTRQPLGLPAWGIRLGRGSGFPGRRRPRGAGLSGRGGRGRSRMKNDLNPAAAPGGNTTDAPYLFKEEEESSMHSTVVLFSSSDTFTLKQDMCVVCGSFGQGVEGRLLACVQCGQCYHPYCVNMKISRVVLSKGWRCLECTVCEACGQASDPARLLLCDDCDISYHTYCLDPPLHNVPNGSWRCKWCVSCTQCGSTSPGLRCEWQSNYTQCAPCASLAACPLCHHSYSENQLMVQCRQCDRWLHAVCLGLLSEAEVAHAADSGVDCSLCQGRASPAHALVAMAPALPLEPVGSVFALTKARDFDPTRTYTQDGVCLTESGLSQLQSLSAAASRRRRTKPKLKLKIINQNSVAVMQAAPEPRAELPHAADDGRDGDPGCDGKSDSSPEREAPYDDAKEADGGKKRKRKPYRPGIGGFMVRQRNRAGQAKTKPGLMRKDSTGSASETLLGKDEGWGESATDTPLDEKPPSLEYVEKTRKRYRKKKTKLEEAFPTYLQEAFFGKDLLDKSKQNRPGCDRGLLEEDRGQTNRMQQRGRFLPPSLNPVAGAAAQPNKAAVPRSADDPLVALADSDLLGMLGKGGDESGLPFSPFQVESPPSAFAAASLVDQTAAPQPSTTRTPRILPEEPLDGILSPELDKMVTDESILSKLYKIPELEGKDVEELFTAVLSPSTSQVPHCSQQGPTALHGPPGPTLPHTVPNSGSGMFPRMVNGMMDPGQQFLPPQMNPAEGPGPPGSFPPSQRMPFSDAVRDPSGGGGGWTTPGPGAATEAEGESLSNAQKSTLKWEKEETLGEQATVAPVLYTNVNFPNLREEYPDWATRVKQIAKLWRKASSQDRAPYVQKARDNRAALRINKVQMSNESIKRQQQHHPSQQLAPPPSPFDPSIPPMDPELLFKEPLKHKESEHEQEWKFRQQMRQKSKQQAKIEATQKLEQVKNEHLQQQQLQQAVGPSDADASSPGPSQPDGGMSPPKHQFNPKSGLPRPGTAASGASDDVFLRPQPPPPSTGTGTSSQPQSPQMFSPGSSGSRPSSPWDPYAKMVGTPRPPSLGPSTQRRNSVESGKSPRSFSDPAERCKTSNEPFGSPTSLDPYAKSPDTPRPAVSTDPFLKPMGPPRAAQPVEGRHLIGSPGHDPFSKPAQRKEIYQRMPQGRMILSDPYARPLLTPIPGSNESGSVQMFKAPMPPQQAQDPYSAVHHGPRRGGGDAFGPVMPSNPQDDCYAQPPLTPRPAIGQDYSSPTRMSRQPQQFPVIRPSGQNPYSHAPPTPRPDYSQFDPYSQPPGTPRPPPDTYGQNASTPQPLLDPYAHPPGTPRPHDQYTSSPVPPRQSCHTPSLSLDPYAQAPGTPHPGMAERFPKSPGCPRNADPYAQPPGTPRPILGDPYAHPPGTPRPGARTLSAQDPFSPPPARPHPLIPGSQTPKHPGICDDSSRANQTPLHDPFEQPPMTPRAQSAERAAHDGKEPSGMGRATAMGAGPFLNAPLAFSTPPSEPQSVPLMEAEERMRQRQRIRELLLKQQQQKGAIRHEKGPQDPPPNPQHWGPEGHGPQAEGFNRPPPPYPGPGLVRGPLRFPGNFPADQRGPVSLEGPFPRPPFPGDASMGMRQHMPRFGFPGAQGPLPRPSYPMQEPMAEPHPHAKRPVDLGNAFGGTPLGTQHFHPRAVPMQQHSIMGQPFIELRHRAPESRFQLPFFPGNPAGPYARPPNQMSSSVDNLHQQAGAPGGSGLPPLMRSLSQPSPAAASLFAVAPAEQSDEILISGAEGEKLDADESAVKDLEDVEVKDLVDADLENLNLDPEDGKDLDLETNDLHLDDFLTAGKFDIIAYTNPDLDLDVKKDMFSEDLDLSDPIEERSESPVLEKRNAVSADSNKVNPGDSLVPPLANIKQENCPHPGSSKEEPDMKPELKNALSQSLEVPPGGSGTKEPIPAVTPASDLPLSAPAPSGLLDKVRSGEGPSDPPDGTPVPPQDASPSAEQGVDTAQGDASSFAQGQAFAADQDAGDAAGCGLGQNRPLLLEEQPLLLQDLLDQEREEQQQQRQMQAMIRQRSSDSFFPNVDFDAITDPIMKAKMVALKGINKVMVQNNMSPMAMNRFPVGQSGPGPQCPEGVAPVQQVVGQDCKPAPRVVRPDPPNFGPGFVNESQKLQYEEWLRDTQHLLQMQQKFLEDQIGAHRKSKKALSAKQRTAKKAGREFPEEDAEQLKHVTEQQGVVQKQLEQVRKQQKEHAELIEEYRVKQQQQQCGVQTPGVPGMPAAMHGPPAMMPAGPAVNQPMMGPGPHVGQQNPPRGPSMPGWHQGVAPVPIGGPMQVGGPRMAAMMPSQGPGGAPSQAVNPGQSGSDSPHVNFDDTNPFSEGFMERERKERLREQQERQRVQLMKEVERQRALKQHMEMEQQQSLMGQEVHMKPLGQMALYSQDLPDDFMQQPQQQQFLQPGLSGSSPRAFMANGAFPQEPGAAFWPENTMMEAAGFNPGQPRPPRFGGTDLKPLPFGQESSTPLPPNFPGSGPSLIQLYSNIIPEEKGKKKRTRKKKSDDDTPSTPRSDLTAPLTPCVSDTSSTPTRLSLHPGEQDICELSQPGSSTPGSAGSLAPSELERQLSADVILSNIKLEQVEGASECYGQRLADLGTVKVEKDATSPHAAGQSPAHSLKGDTGNELLKHLLKNKGTPPPMLSHQRSEDSLRSEEDGYTDCKALLRQSSADSNGTLSDSQPSGHPDFPGPLIPDHDWKKQRNKRMPKSAERPAPRSKKRKKEEEERQITGSASDPVMTHLKQLSLLPLMEPLIGVNFAHFVPYGSGQLDGESRLSGTFGSASLDGVSDYYSQLIYKQNNLSNPPTPPASLPPTPPPMVRQKILNGFATADELTGRAALGGSHDVTKGLVLRPFQLKAEEEMLARALSQAPKTVDVPASLPTPPHNNQEELRGQEQGEDRDSPDSFVPSSSPESVVDIEISRYPDLTLVKQERPSPAPSPVIPLLPSCSGTEVRLRDIKKEPTSTIFSPLHNGSDSGLVSIAITLKPAAAENITGVVTAIAELLHVKIPSSYEVSSAPDRPLQGTMGACRTPAAAPRGPGVSQGAAVRLTGPGAHQVMYDQKLQQLPRFPTARDLATPTEISMKGRSSPGPKPQWCRHCKVVVLGNGVRRSPKDPKRDTQETPLAADGEMVFCSHTCLILHSSSSPGKTPVDNKEAMGVYCGGLSKVPHQYSNNMSSLDVHCLAQMQPKLSPYTLATPAPHEPIKAEFLEEKPLEALRVTMKLKSRDPSASDTPPPHHGKRPKGLRWRKWAVQLSGHKGVVPTVGGQAVEDEAEVDVLLRKLGAPLRPKPLPRDRRRCCFCHQEGDGLTDGPARLLNLDLDTWVHLNCALWSTEVYETQAGALINVELALRRGTGVCCAACQRTGATTGCHRLRCLNVYHFTCALQAGCTFFKDKTMLCHAHRPRAAGGVAAGAALLEHQLRCFAVFRRVYVQRDEVRQMAGAVQRPERGHTFRVGSLVFHAMGQLLPGQMPDFHSDAAIFPVGYEAGRFYWSMRHANRRCHYLCSVEEKGARPEFVIRVQEAGYDELVLTGSSAKGVWNKVLGPVAERRAESAMLRLFPVYLKGEDLFGLTVSAVARIAESLPGVEACKGYRFRFGRNPLLEIPVEVNPSGSARTQSRTRPIPGRYAFPRKPACTRRSGRNDDRCFSTRPQSSSVLNSAPPDGGCPYSRHFVHSKSSQYRRLQSEWRLNVYLAQSRVQGLGLFAAKDIEKQTMVMEYLGNVLRSEVASRKVLMYHRQNRIVYMFRIDAEWVIDATLTGGLARYINHSCAPNCVAEVVAFERGYKIIISASRRIEKGEELCYDYRLEQVEDQHKIQCHCGAVNCRKWIN